MKLLPVLLTALLFACTPKPATTNTPANNADTSPSGNITIEDLDKKHPNASKAYFAGGCFWCTEAAFDRINGVIDVWSGYAGGEEANPTYREVAYGLTGHAEAIVVYYDAAVINYDKLLDIFFVAHDPTQLNRQGPDKGTQYRSAIFFLNNEQELAAKAKLKQLEAAKKFTNPIVTEVTKAGTFWVAEDYHQDYYEDSSNPNQSYVQNVSKPKVEKVKKVFADILKPQYQN